MDENNNIEVSTSLSSDLSNRGKITIQLEELLVAGNYDEAKLLLEPSQPVDIADAIGSLKSQRRTKEKKTIKNRK
jgi:magnesium transporter